MSYNIGKNPCPQCRESGEDSSGDNFYWYGEEGGGHCWACGFTIKSKEYSFGERKVSISNLDYNKFEEKKFKNDDVLSIIEDTSEELSVGYRGLNKDVCFDLGVRWKYNPESGKVSHMYFPATYLEDGEIKVSGYKIRNCPKDFFSKGYVGKVNLLGGQTQAVAETLIIVGGEIDLISAKQMLLPIEKKYNRKINVVTSLLGEDSTSDVLKSNIDWVNKHKKIILALDNDDAGKKASDKCIDILDKDKLFTANLRYKDINEYLKNKDVDSFSQDAYWNASPVENYGIIGSGDLFQYGIDASSDEGIPIPFHMYDLKPYVPMFMYDSITLIVGSTSVGKTANLDSTTESIVMSSKENVGILSLESSRKKFAQKTASRIIGTPLNRLSKEEQIDLQIKYKDKIMDYYLNEDGEHRFYFADSDFDTIEEAEKCIIRLIKINGCKVIVLDPLQNIIGNKTNEEQRSFMLFLEKIKKRYGVLVLIGTHTRKASSGEKSGSDGGVQKEDSIEGSGSISKSASLIITLSRNKNAEDWVERNTTYYSVPKNRDFEMTGELVAKSFYRASCSRLYPYSYAESKNFFRDDKFGEIVDEDNGFFFSSEDFEALTDNVNISAITQSVQYNEEKEDQLANW